MGTEPGTEIRGGDMVKTNKLSAKEIEHAKVGKHGDGGGLWLVVRENGSRAWVFRYNRNGRERSMGLGPLGDTPLADAREEARKARRQLRRGKDPITEKRLAKRPDVPTFSEAANRYAEAHKAKWSNDHHRKMWRRQLEIHADPKIGKLPVNEIDIPDVLRVLEPLWFTSNETASRIRGRIEKILSWAAVHRYRTGENPARWRGVLDALLPAPGEVQTVEHYSALPWADVPAFMVKLREKDTTSARALEFQILTASRSGEVRGATWSEIDLDAKLWTIPGDRMKAGAEHRVPLSDQAVELLRSIPRVEGVELVFPSPRSNSKMISDMTMSKTLKDMNVRAVPHGFRSSFRDWCAESTSYAREVAEQALAHTVENKVEAAYRRGDLLAKRRKLMQAWGDYLDTVPAEGEAGADVVPIGQAK